ncbi:MAG: hypothetical protein P4L27_04035 [Ignavibacteriaceae bacterium]|nr:hypothetical protein [Ignavibacteriaceae bacterium]
MKKSHRVVVFILFLSSLIFPQGKSSIQFSGGIAHPISSNSGLSGALQFNYNINSRFNYFISVDYTAWDKRNFSYLDDDYSLRTGYSETDHTLLRITAGGRYLIIEPDQFKLFVEAGIGYSYLVYDSYDMQRINNPDGTTALLITRAGNVHLNLFNFSPGIGFIHPITKKWDILFEFKLNTYLNAQYYSLFSSFSTFSSFQFGFNYKM